MCVCFLQISRHGQKWILELGTKELNPCAKLQKKVNIPGNIPQDFVIIANASVHQDRLDHWKYAYAWRDSGPYVDAQTTLYSPTDPEWSWYLCRGPQNETQPKEMKQVYYVTNTRHTPALPTLFIDQNTLKVNDSKSWGHHPCHGRLRWNTCWPQRKGWWRIFLYKLVNMD